MRGTTLANLGTTIGGLDEAAMAAAMGRQAQLTKPAGALGRLEDLAVHLAGVQGTARPSVARRAVLVGVGDHGVVAEGVSAYPQPVTMQMVANFLAGGAAVNVLAERAGARMLVCDFGIASEIADERVIQAAVRRGTGNMAVEPAMTRAEAEAAIAEGYAVASKLAGESLDILAIGEMGIGNTTAAAALTAVFAGARVEAVTGRGTGIDDASLAKKVRVIERALALHRPDPADPIGVLAAVGGLEIAGLAGAMLGAAANRVAVVLDGYITTAAALVAAAIVPAVRDCLIAAHRSVEPGHGIALEALGLEPLLDLRMRLGEGTGALLAMQVIDAAVAAHNGMATFAEAGVSGRTE